METRVAIVCRPVVAPGVALTGLPVVEVCGDEPATAAVIAAGERSGAAVLLVEETILAGLADDERRRLAARSLPVVVPFPGPHRPAGEGPEAYILELLRRAIGYRVRLR